MGSLDLRPEFDGRKFLIRTKRDGNSLDILCTSGRDICELVKIELSSKGTRIFGGADAVYLPRALNEDPYNKENTEEHPDVRGCFQYIIAEYPEFENALLGFIKFSDYPLNQPVFGVEFPPAEPDYKLN